MSKNKEQVIQHYRHSIELAKQWGLFTNELWCATIAEGKWTIAEVVGHFIPWDDFVRLKRIPYFLNGDSLPNGLDVELTNRQSAIISRHRSQEEITAEFIYSRKRLIAAIEQIGDDQWEREYIFNQTVLPLSVYFKGLLEHDEHHFRQIESVRRQR